MDELMGAGFMKRGPHDRLLESGIDHPGQGAAWLLLQDPRSADLEIPDSQPIESSLWQQRAPDLP